MTEERKTELLAIIEALPWPDRIRFGILRELFTIAQGGIDQLTAENDALPGPPADMEPLILARWKIRELGRRVLERRLTAEEFDREVLAIAECLRGERGEAAGGLQIAGCC